MTKIAWPLLTMLWLTSAPLIAASPPPQQPVPEEGSRAEEWKARRQQKRQQVAPPRTSGLQKGLLFLEGGGVEQALTIRYKDFYPKFGQISPSSGTAWGLRYFKSNLGGSPLTLETSAAFSFLDYRQANLHFGRFSKIAPHFFLGPAVLGAPFQFGEAQPEQVQSFLYAELQYRYFPQEIFYGLGQDSSLDNQTDFLLEEGFYSVVAGHQFNRWLGAGARLGYVKVNVGRGSDDDFPNIQDLFDDVSAPGLERQPDFLRIDSALYLDSRNTPGNPHQGGALGIGYSRIDDRGGDDFEFNRLSLDARAYLSLGSRQRILAMRLYGAWDDARDDSRVPFYMQRTLGGGRKPCAVFENCGFATAINSISRSNTAGKRPLPSKRPSSMTPGRSFRKATNSNSTISTRASASGSGSSDPSACCSGWTSRKVRKGPGFISSSGPLFKRKNTLR